MFLCNPKAGINASSYGGPRAALKVSVSYFNLKIVMPFYL
jgi:hypothetical protein